MWQCFEYDELGSTNDEAVRLSASGSRTLFGGYGQKTDRRSRTPRTQLAEFGRQFVFVAGIAV